MDITRKPLGTLALCAAAALPAAALAGTEVHHVGAVDDALFVGVAKAVDPENPDRRAVAAYFCDSESVWSWVGGMVEGDAAAFADDRLALDLDFSGDTVAGSVSIDGGPPQPFTTEIAGADSGIFVPEGGAIAEDEDVAYIGGWIVLLAGLQRGALTLDVVQAQLDTGPTASDNGWMFPSLDPAARTADTEFGRIAATATLNLADCFGGGNDCPLN
jgi:hypothetical protein